MPRLPASLLMMVLPMLGGCAEYWARPGGTPAEFETARLGCTQMALGQLPQVFAPAMVSTGYVVPPSATCSRNGNSCIATPGYVMPPSYVMADQNVGPRSDMVRSCLIAQGWIPTDSETVAARITNAPAPPPAPPNPAAASPSGSPSPR